MPGTDVRKELSVLLEACARCRWEFNDNATLLAADDEGTLTEEQAVAVLAHLLGLHKGHKRYVQ